jgi:hypothetical protein
MTYNPNDPNDPLRHNYLARVDRSNDRRMPIEEKIANGLGGNDRQGFFVAQTRHSPVSEGNFVLRSVRTVARTFGA